MALHCMSATAVTGVGARRKGGAGRKRRPSYQESTGDCQRKVHWTVPWLIVGTTSDKTRPGCG